MPSPDLTARYGSQITQAAAATVAGLVRGAYRGCAWLAAPWVIQDLCLGFSLVHVPLTVTADCRRGCVCVPIGTHQPGRNHQAREGEREAH
jgi:hypothetical protein